jgi:hypothetical protein
VLEFSGNANGSPQIAREVERAVHKGVPIVPVRIEDVTPSAALEYFCFSPHWLDAFPPPRRQRLDKLTDSVKRLLESNFVRPVSPEPQGAGKLTELVQAEKSLVAEPLPPQSPVSPPAPKTTNWLVAAGTLAVLALGGGAALLFFARTRLRQPQSGPVPRQLGAEGVR